MASILFLVSGIAGVFAMLASFFVFDAGLQSAISVWFATGVAISLCGLLLTLVPNSAQESSQLSEA
jgi:hypothetical protein